MASGIWHEDEYAKLPRYDQSLELQPAAVFLCHQGDPEQACAGWLGHADPYGLLAVRLGVISGEVDPSCLDYSTDVPLFTSGAAASAHGVREIRSPGAAAISTIGKVVRVRVARGVPVTSD